MDSVKKTLPWNLIKGTQTMSEILFGERNSTELMDLLNQETAKWGIVVENIELQNISLPTDIQRSMAAEAGAEKKSKARVRSFDCNLTMI